jgi:hypothetical protein
LGTKQLLPQYRERYEKSTLENRRLSQNIATMLGLCQDVLRQEAPCLQIEDLVVVNEIRHLMLMDAAMVHVHLSIVFCS